MEEWKECRIGDVCETQTGPFGCQLHNEDYVAEGTPIVTVEHLGNRNFTTQNLPLISDEDKNRLNKYILKEGDVVFSRVGSVDRCSYVSTAYDGWLFSGRCLRVRAKDSNLLDSTFLYYHFNNENIRTYIRNVAVGATMPSINTKLLNEVPVKLPPIEVQKKIAGILSSLDEKIETNRKINARLEELAQGLFKSWFIDFEPFGGVMPDEWSNCKLKDLAIITSGKRPGDKFTESSQPQILFPIIGASSIMGYTSNYLYDEPILVIGRVGTHGIVQRWSDRCWPSDNTLVITSKFYEYVYNVLRGIDYDSLNRGSTQPLITQSDIKRVEVILPPIEILEVFEKRISSIYSQYDILTKESACLAELRDALLPKLMSGEIKVG